MITNTCITCGGELLTNSGQTFCPACLLQQGMKSSTYGGNGPRVAWRPPETEQLATAFPHLEIQQLLGVGGMGAVFKVRQKELDRIAALKVLPGEMAADAGFTERFLREARLLASLSHPHIVTVYEFGQRDGIYFLLMEFIDGVTLRQALRAEPIKKLASKETLAIVGQLCDALQFAHDEGVVHRDIKPENILIDKRGRVKIADFGLARLLGQSPTMPTLTGTHQLMGTPAYMAPEQIEGLPGIDHRADIYSMGVVFYELLTGELPLGRFSPPSERAETDVRLDEVVLRTLAREPDRRYQQASQVKTDVEALQVPAAMAPSAIPSRQRKVGIGVAGFIAGALVTPVIFVLLYLTFEDRRASRPQETITGGSHNVIVSSNPNESPPTNDRIPNKSLDTNIGRPVMTGPGGTAGMSETFSSQPTICFQDDGTPLLPNWHFTSLSAEQRAAVNQILKETHTRYLKEEALHSLVSVDESGTQTTEIKPFPEQLRQIENELWTKLDDVVPLEIEKAFRDQLCLFARSASVPGTIGGVAPPGSDEPPAIFGIPGILGWAVSDMPLKIQIVPSGRWFEWMITDCKMTTVHNKARSLPLLLEQYYREPGPWMAVANAKVAYESREWMKVADCFTRTGKFRWYMAESWAVNQDKFGDLDDGHRSAYKSAVESLSTFLEKARPADELSVQIERQLQTVQSRLIDGQPDDIDAILQESALFFSEDLGNAWFLLSVVNSGTRGVRPFEPATYALVNVQLEASESAVGYFQRTGEDAPIPVRFRLVNGQWKIDSIGTSAELQQQVRITQDRENGASPRAVTEAFGQAMADGRYSVAVQCMTDLARDEWLGEMIVAILKHNGMESLHSRYSRSIALPSSAQIDALMNRMREIMPETIGSGTFFKTALENSALTANERREVTNELAKKFPDRDGLLQLLLATRAAGKTDEFKVKGTFSNSSDTKPTITKTGTWTWNADSGLPSVEVRLLQLDVVLWKLDTIIDPALKPWPLVGEPSTPETE